MKVDYYTKIVLTLIGLFTGIIAWNGSHPLSSPVYAAQPAEQRADLSEWQFATSTGAFWMFNSKNGDIWTYQLQGGVWTHVGHLIEPGQALR